MTTFPNILFRDDTAPALQVVNNGDLNLPSMRRRLAGTASSQVVVASSDATEIDRRRQLSTWLLKYPDVCDWLSNQSFDPMIPLDHYDFSREFHSSHKYGSRFFNRLGDFLEQYDAFEEKGTVPASVSEFFAYLAEHMTEAKRTEQNLRATAEIYLNRAANIAGTIDLVVDGKGEKSEITDSAISGYRLYRNQPLHDLRRSVPAWAAHRKVLGYIPRARVRRHNRQIDLQDYGGQIIYEVDYTLLDIATRLAKSLVRAVDEKSNRWNFKFYFHYEQGELRMKVIDFSVTVPRSARGDVWKTASSSALRGNVYVELAGYSASDRARASRIGEQIDKASIEGPYKRRRELELMANQELQGLFSSRGMLIEDEAFQSHYANYALEKLCTTDEIPVVKEFYEDVKSRRDWIGLRLGQLIEHATVLNRMMQITEDGVVPLTMPTLLPDGKHLVQFTSLIPMHLVGQKSPAGTKMEPEDLVPITDLAKLNGSIVMITGANAGGKTVTLESVAEAVYLAQCGLPIFGTDFQLNPKTVLGLNFIERGDGSTAQLLLEKMKSILAAAKESDPAKTLIITDEMGTGTQEADGDALSRRIIGALHGYGCSVLASSQIIALTEHVRDEYGALPFQVGRDRKIKPGIGRGDVEGLAAQIGLDDYLN